MKIQLEKPAVNISLGKMKKLDGGVLHEKPRLDLYLFTGKNEWKSK